MAQRKVGFSSNSNIQGDKLILNYGLTATLGFEWVGATSATYILPEVDGASSSVLTTDGNGNLVWNTINTGTGNVQGTMSSTYIPKYIAGYGLTDSSIYNTNSQILFPSGQSGTPSIAFQGDTDLGIYRSAANTLVVTSNNQDGASFKYNEVIIEPTGGTTQLYVSNGSLALSQATQIDISAPYLRWTGHSYNDGDILMWENLNQRIVGVDPSIFSTPGPTGPTGVAGSNGTNGATGSGLGILWQTLTDASNITWDYNNGVNAVVTINGNRTLTISNAATGSSGTLKIIQGTTGSYRINFGVNDKFSYATYSFTTTGGRWDIYGWIYDGTYYNWTYANNFY